MLVKHGMTYGKWIEQQERKQFTFQDGHFPDAEPAQPAEDIPPRLQNQLRRRPHIQVTFTLLFPWMPQPQAGKLGS